MKNYFRFGLIRLVQVLLLSTITLQTHTCFASMQRAAVAKEVAKGAPAKAAAGKPTLLQKRRGGLSLRLDTAADIDYTGGGAVEEGVASAAAAKAGNGGPSAATDDIPGAIRASYSMCDRCGEVTHIKATLPGNTAATGYTVQCTNGGCLFKKEITPPGDRKRDAGKFKAPKAPPAKKGVPRKRKVALAASAPVPSAAAPPPEMGHAFPAPQVQPKGGVSSAKRRRPGTPSKGR